ncbi:outer membrane beta-barrel protein [uncultured Psychroserpens sp.]|uniref:outer membrane beta-barrel protein n=1 Tax=uncultured Psychroserpens sp. TaxID=255436 RepID=UPI002631EFFF|nr:outer membrane beta-barrel protein [uncultured Psychroserpens sp.]
MKNTIVFLIILICTIKILPGQDKVVLTGKVQDSLSQPLEFSNVVIYKNKSTQIFTYAITDEYGKFKVETFKDSSYTLKASFIGFENYIYHFKSVKDDYKLITLNEVKDALDQITIVYDLPVKVSGDTISYRVNAFTNGNERKLEDVIGKLPGFEIDDDGNIKVQGKKVNKIMVDGKTFFSGDTKLATKNIPADVVEKINVLNNFNDIRPTAGLQDNDKIALDIRLKDGKKNIVFGSVEAGLGTHERYNSHANIFYFNPKISINFIGDLNNIGEQALTFQDYFKFNGGFRTAGKKSSFNISSDLLGLTGLQDNKAQNSISKLGALNYNFNPNKKLSFSGFLIHSEIDYDLLSVAQKSYIREDDNSFESLSSRIHQKSSSDLIKLSAKYIPNSKLHFQYDALFNNTSLLEESARNSIFDDEENNIDQNKKNRPMSFQQKLGMYYALNEKNIYALAMTHGHKNQRNPLRLFSQDRLFNTIIPFTDSGNYNVLQNLEQKTNSFSTALNYYYVINPLNHININSGVDYNYQWLSSNIVQNTGESEIEFDDSNLLNQTRYNFTDIYIGVTYRTKLDKLTINTGLALHNYNAENEQILTSFKIHKSLILPNIKLRYDFKKTRNLTLNYDINPEFSDIQRLTQGLVIKDYNALFQGNPELNNAIYQNFNLSYYDFNSYNFSNLYAVLSYQIKENDFNNTLTYNDINSISSTANISSPNKVFSGFVNYDRRFKPVKINASLSISVLDYKSILQELFVDNQSVSQDYKVSVETRMDNFPIIELGLRTLFNNYKSDAIGNQSYSSTRPFANIELSFLKDFIFTADYQYTFYNNNTNNSTIEYDFLDANLFYQKEGSDFEFKLSGTNLLNTSAIRNDAFSENFISTSQYFVQPRFLLASIIYSF